MEYREEQKKIMEYTEGYMAVPSVPGAGKTFILTHLAVKLIKEKRHYPGKILIVTYMRSAVNNFKSKIANLLEQEGIYSSNDYEVMTIHSLATKIVKDKPEILCVDDEFEIIDSSNQVYLLDRCMRIWLDKNRDAFKWFLDEEKLKNRDRGYIYQRWYRNLMKTVSSMISEFKNKKLSPSDVRFLSDGNPDYSILKISSEVYSSYDDLMKYYGYVDYDDLLLFAYRALCEDEKLLKKFQTKYTYIMEDEAQDSNGIQQDVLMMLSKTSGNYVRVGDPNQAIMGTFTSSDPKLFLDFINAKDVKVEKMLTSGRSGEDIIDLANYLVEWTRENHEVEECRNALEDQMIKPLKPGVKDSKYRVRCYDLKNWDDEKEKLLDLSTRFKKMHPDETCAVLLPSNNKVSDFAETLRQHKVEYEEISETSKERMFIIRGLGYIIGYLGEPDNNEKFIKLLDEVMLLDEYDNRRELFEFLKTCPLEDIFYPSSKEKLDVDDRLKNTLIWKDFMKSRDIIKDILYYPQNCLDKLLIYISERLELDSENKAVVQKVAKDIDYLFKVNPKWSLEELSKELLKTRDNRFSYFASVINDLKGYEPEPGKITLATYHKSKGLEWDMVILAGLESGFFPARENDSFIGEHYYLKDEYSSPLAVGKAELESALASIQYDEPIRQAKIENMKEKARLLYVGVTRAKKYLCITSNRGHWNKKGIPWSAYYVEFKNYTEEERRIKRARY